MSDFLTAMFVAFGVIFVAELGDKSQLVSLNFGSRYPLRVVALGLTLGFGAAGIAAAAVGGLLGSALPARPIELVGGIIFLAFAALALRRGSDEEGRIHSRSTSVVASIALTIAIAEMGDKTQVATATLAANASPVATWVGATAGAVASSMVGAFAGRSLGDRLPETAFRWASAVVFAVFGVAMIAGWL